MSTDLALLWHKICEHQILSTEPAKFSEKFVSIKSDASATHKLNNDDENFARVT
jgi:hypothetical protein